MHETDAAFQVTSIMDLAKECPELCAHFKTFFAVCKKD
jgi:hypothetical protein